MKLKRAVVKVVAAAAAAAASCQQNSCWFNVSIWHGAPYSTLLGDTGVSRRGGKIHALSFGHTCKHVKRRDLEVSAQTNIENHVDKDQAAFNIRR